MTEVSGYVLAGGESSRMQGTGLPRHKALLVLDGETLLERALRTLRSVCVDASILCGPPERRSDFRDFGRTIEDGSPGRGPLGGLEAALRDATSEWVLLLPVDLPLLPSAALACLIEEGTEIGPGVACFEAAYRLQPLPVLLHRAAYSSVAASLARREQKLLSVLQRAAQEMSSMGLCVVPAEAFAPELDASIWFTNVNTPDDFRAAGELLAAQNGLLPRASD